MKAKDAARILNDIDMDVRLERMKERASATVLAEMEPGEARAVTLELARRRDLALPAN